MTQLLLTAFVAYWLRSQYQSSRERLVKELSDCYVNTHDELLDTLLFKSYVNPLLKGKKIITVNLRPDKDSISIINDSIFAIRETEDIILRSVRMIVSHSEDSSGPVKSHVSAVGFNIDSAAFSRHFHRKMNDAGMRFGFNWNTAEGESVSAVTGKVIIMDPLPGSALPVGRVSVYGWYLLLSILPQLLFGLFLILLSSLAFILTYRNLRDHTVLNNLRDEFIGNMTHELKTPVATLSVALEALGRYNLRNEPVVLDEYLRLASQETARLEELINRVLDHSLLESNSQITKMSETDINTLVSEAVDLMKIRLTEGSVTFFSSDEEIIVMCDRLYLKSVVLNLIDNSLKYCDKTPEINVFTRKEGQHAVIEVSDNGPGIPEEYHDRIFEKFFRLPSGNIHNVKGYGLGLSFASLVMKVHGGTIRIRNHTPGCSFIIKLPSA
ncbi:MAG: HAMP domain-containing histidine kinase [Bacteroidales bacterium]|nr:HAMP domain-containing histidine kinase [Bacteroidales bacterium]